MRNCRYYKRSVGRTVAVQALVLLASGTFSSSANANEASAPTTAPEPTTAFTQGKFALTVEGDYGHSFDLSRARFESGSVGLGWYFLDNFSLNVEAAGIAMQRAEPDVAISELNFKLRQHIYNNGPLSIYLDAGGGISYATDPTPAGGTYFNFTIQTGPGVAWQIRPNTFLIGGARYWHLSNAQIEGKQRNPSINAIEGYVGVMFIF